MLSHQNIICNILQSYVFDGPALKTMGVKTQVSLGLLPLGHAYGLTLVAHAAQYRGDEVIILPKFELKSFLEAVQRFKIELLYVVPPIVIQMIRNQDVCANFDLSSVRYLSSGAAPLGVELVNDVRKTYPKWHIGQAYGMYMA